MTWIYSIPGWAFAMLVVGVMSLLAGGGVLYVRRRFWRSREEQRSHNDVAGPILGIVGTILAVMLSFMVVTEWQEFDAASSGVQTEASAVIDMYHMSQSLPKPVFESLRSALRDYVEQVVNDEWPKMRRGEQSAAAHNTVYRLFAILSNYEPKTIGRRVLQEQELMLARTLADARRERLYADEESVPGPLWVALIVLGLLTIGFCCFFWVKNAAVHVAMTVALAAVIGLMFVLIAEFDLPFRGDIHVTPVAFKHAHEVVMGTELTR